MVFRNLIVSYIRKGLSYREIGNLFGVSRQRIHQVVTGYISPSNRPKRKEVKQKILVRKMRKKKSLTFCGSRVDYRRGGREQINEMVRVRDGHRCQLCGKKWEPGKRRFDVHHLEPKMDGRSRERGILKYNRENLDKLITLCHPCHFSLDTTRKKLLIDYPQL